MPAEVRVAGVLLAAGRGRRFGGSKLLTPLGGVPLVRRALESALASELCQVAAVCSPEVAACLPGDPRLRVVVNTSPDLGQAHSLVLGLAALDPDTTHALFLLADQPLIDAELVNDYVGLSREGAVAACLEQGDLRGPPALFARALFPRLAALTGDQGARRLLDDPTLEVWPVPPRHAGQGLDVDTPADLTRAADILAGGGVGPGGLAGLLGVEPPALVSLVGAGGKTTLMHRLARELGKRGLSVLVTTTTRIHPPPWETLLEPDAAALGRLLRRRLASGGVLAAAAGAEHHGRRLKLVGIRPADLDDLFLSGAADVILVEADGAAGRPLKAPRAHEPVVPGRSTLVLGLIGLAALGRAATAQNVLGLAGLAAVCGLEAGQTITPEHLMRLIAHPDGLFKGAPPSARKVAILNQADAAAGADLASAARRLGMPGPEVWAGSLGLGRLECLVRGGREAS